ncbi:MAG: Gfo/Idh/MocA family oxidoreductase [Sedimentisphaerales bacterium]|nr:Gfo/Idh/MocA family oxidoreductase [Sedimentisphaerales bacterium]
MARTSRRHFLKQTGAAVGASALPRFVPAPALGAAGGVAPSERIVMGGIGLGGQGQRNMRNFITHSDVQWVAVCDVDTDRRNQAKAIADGTYGNTDCAAYVDFRELLARRDIDAVLIATSDRWHAPLSVMAAKAGKDIYCEKPMSLTVAEGRAVADTVRRYGTVYQCGTQRRSMRTFSFAVQLARSGKLGKLTTLRSYVRAGSACPVLSPQPVPASLNYDLWLGPAPYRPYHKSFVYEHLYNNNFAYSGGMITDWGTHCNDLAQWANDSERAGPLEFEGTAKFPRDGFGDVPTALHVEATYANGVKLVMHDRKERPLWPTDNSELAVMFQGTEGWVYADDGGNVLAQPESLLEQQRFQRQTWMDAANWTAHHRNFLDCIKTRRDPIAPAEIAHRSVTTCHVASICLRLGRKLRWDPTTETFPDDAEANRLLARAMRSPWHI